MKGELFDCRDAFSTTLVDLALKDPRIVAVTNDAVNSSKLDEFARLFPGRLVNVGIAEQNMMGIAAGLANGGKIPFVSGPSCFLTARAMEQIKVDVAYSQSNVKICGQWSGVAYGVMGATHHSVEDIAWTRVIAGLPVIVPAGPIETAAVVRHAAREEGPMFLRMSRMGVPEIHTTDYQFKLGKADRLRDGSDVTLIANGTMVHRALDAARILAGSGIDAAVLNMSTVSPLDREAVVDAAEVTGAIVTIEEASVRGGLGAAVAEVLVAECPIPMQILGVPPVFAPTGDALWFLDHCGLNAVGIVEAAYSVMNRAA